MPIGDALMAILQTLRDPRVVHVRRRVTGPLARLARRQVRACPRLFRPRLFRPRLFRPHLSRPQLPDPLSRRLSR